MKKYLNFEMDSYDPFIVDEINWRYAEKSRYTHKIDLPICVDYTIGQNEKLYFLPGTYVPRVKLKDIFAQTKSKTTTNLSDATKIVIGGKSTDTLIDGAWFYEVNVVAFKEVLDHVKNHTLHLDSTTYDNIMELLSVYTEDIVLCDYKFVRYIKGSSLSNYIYNNIISDSSQYYSYIKDGYTDLYEELFQLNATLYAEETLIGLINSSDFTTIDKKMFDSINDMFESSDKDNVVVAMEIMANSNYQESLYYLCLLFEAHHGKIADQRSRNHVNFKSLCSYMGFTSPSYCMLTKDEILNLLMEKRVFNATMAIDLLKKYSSDVKQHGESAGFKISKITLCDEALNYLANLQVNQNESVADPQ